MRSLNRGTVCSYSRYQPDYNCPQQVPKRVARPTSNIKSMLMGRGDASKKRKKEVGVAGTGPQLVLTGVFPYRKVSQ